MCSYLFFEKNEKFRSEPFPNVFIFAAATGRTGSASELFSILELTRLEHCET